MRRGKERKFLLGGMLVLGLLIGGFVYAQYFAPAHVYEAPEATALNRTTGTVGQAPEPIELVFLGDMMFDRGVETAVKNHHEGDFSRLFDNLSFLHDADIVFGNLEGPVSDVGRNVGSKWSFRMDPAVLEPLRNAGFNIVSFANNHVGDWSQVAFEDTLNRLDAADILYTGAGENYEAAKTPTVITIDGTTIGFLGFTDVGPNWMEASDIKAGILLASDPNFETIISEASSSVDVLVTSFHWGDEYVPHNQQQTNLAHQAIEAGADMVIGHHPHVIQDIEWYQDKLIAYSLGNFVFDQYFSNETMQGLMLRVTLLENEITDVTREIIELDRTYTPQPPRPFETSDVVTSRVSTKSLCPKTTPPPKDLSLFNVNHSNSLGNYQPAQLTHMNNRIDARGTATCVTPDTAQALEDMVNDARDKGLKLVMTSGYRSADIQKILYDKNQADNENVLYPSVAKPGHSEHQLGTTVDLKSLNTPELSYAQFGGSPEYTWLVENAHQYGFVQSYPVGKEHITGYIAEPWHWRYVGPTTARKIKDSGLTVTEFLETYEL